MKQRRGFTLVELLVTIGIIAALAALLIPALQRGISSANDTKCLGNLRQLAAATTSYAVDRGQLPSTDISSVDASTQKVVGSSGNDRLMMAIYPYLSDVHVFQCPVVMRVTTYPYELDGRYNSTYNQNVYTLAARLSNIPSPSKTILIYEGLPFLTTSGTPPNHTLETYSPISSVFMVHQTPLGQILGTNVAMVDGSVRKDLYYISSDDSRNTLPADGGIWGADRGSFNQ